MPTSKYDPKYCQLTIDMMSKGKSKTQVASAIGVRRDTLDDWAKRHPDYNEALTLGVEASKSFYEDKLQEFATSHDLKSSAAVKALDFLMANRFRDDYTKTTLQQQEINVNHIHKLSDKELDEQIKRLMSNQFSGVLIEGEVLSTEESGNNEDGQ